MDLLTHALTSLAAARAGRKWLPRGGVAIVIVSGLAPDLDYASELGGAASFLQFHRGAFHGFMGATLLTCVVAAGAFWAIRKSSAKNVPVTLMFRSALVASALGVALHLALDFFSGPGVMFLWPLSTKWWGLDIAREFDPWLLVLLIAGILLPPLFGLVSDEIGERRRGPRGGIAATVTLLLLAGYLGFRAELRARAIHLLVSNEFHGRAPVAAGAFPLAGNPFEWRGVVSTENTIEVVLVPVNEGDFDPDRSLTYYKPADSPSLQAAEKSTAAKRFLQYARFPLANLQQAQFGTVVNFRDLRFEAADASAENIVAVVELNGELQIQKEEFHYAGSGR